MLKLTPEFLLNLINIPIGTYVNQIGYYAGVYNFKYIFIPMVYPLKIEPIKVLTLKHLNTEIEYSFGSNRFLISSRVEMLHIKKHFEFFNVDPIITTDILIDKELVKFYKHNFNRVYVIPVARYSCQI